MQALKHGVGVFARLEHHSGCIVRVRNQLPSSQLVEPCLASLSSVVDMPPLDLLASGPWFAGSFGVAFEAVALSRSLGSLGRWTGIELGRMMVVVRRRRTSWLVGP